ncbi:MBL fold metallo-hydrolase [Alkalicoccus urumqiensis]|nr:MBL fold metallo-hydrolase [Alkalicoccus urumqiensis]
MKVTVIGSWGAYPEKGEATSCYLVETQTEKWLLDCGSGALSCLPEFVRLEEIDRIFISHRHTDHTADAGAFVYSRLVAQALGSTDRPVHIYAPAEERAWLNSIVKEKAAVAHTYESGDSWMIDDVTWSFHRTAHPVPCWALRLEENNAALCYTADAVYDESLVNFASGASLLIAEASFYEDQPAADYGHMTSTEAGRLAEKAGAQELWLTHFPHFGNRSDLVMEAEKVYRGNVSTAEKGKSKRIG